MFLENFHKFIKYYGQGKALKLSNFIILSIIAGLLELVGIALIYPFILLIINPSNQLLQKIPFINANNNINTGLIIGFIAILIFISKNIFMIFVQYIQNKFVSDWKKDITSKFMEYYIYAPYKEIMKTSQTDKLYNIEVICNIAVDGFIMRGLNLLTNAVIITMILGLLFIKFPIPAISTLIFVITTMYIQNKFFKKRTTLLANTMTEKCRQYKQSVMENINNIKELKILSAEQYFYEKYLATENDYRKVQTLQGFYNAIPPYIIEMLTVASLLILASILSFQNGGNNSSLIASLAIVIASMFRIAPALNRIQSSIININSTRDFVKKINEEYEKCNLSNFKYLNSSINEKINFTQKISLKNINFSYTPSKQIIKNVSFDINKGDFIGIIGLSGAGKSTLADIITGLLPADSGEIIVDNTKLTQENFSKLRHIIGYVPQQINILDKTIKENIAWGCEKVDEQGVIKALKAAQIYDVIEEYPNGINANIIIGSNGLSQGQKQRLAIARALYRDPEIIILDEATSSLDVQVENEITEMLKNISKSKTIIAIAHRLSTLKACNKLIYMKDGQVIDIGTFEELSARYADFAHLVELSSIK
ncbi:aTP-binding protein of ABC transporter [Clostridium sp. CAG:768]|nr:aTP-binding protein of ABC transporter [Clostridium sp. CAG:768]